MARYESRRRRFEPIAIIGLFVTLALHVGAVAGVMIYRVMQAAAQKPPPPPSFVVARLIRKGVRKPEKKLPNKIIPQQSTRKKEAVDLSADANDAPVKRERRERKPVSDRQRNALDKIEQLAQAQREIEQEGDPNGVVGGSSEARQGDRYMTRIADIWNRTWSLPAVIPREDAKSLYTLVVILIDNEGKITKVQIDRSSGNPHFDNSVIVAWNQIKQLPVPPPERLAAIVANGLALKLTWRGMR